VAHSGWFALGHEVDGFPFLIGEHRIAGHFRAVAPEHGQVQHTPGDNHVEGQRRLEAHALLQLQLLDPTAAFQDLEIDLDLPSAKVPRELFDCLFRGLDGEVGQEHPVERIFPGRRLCLGGEQDGDGDVGQGAVGPRWCLQGYSHRLDVLVNGTRTPAIGEVVKRKQARYQAQLAQRRYQNVDPDNRLVARGLEAAWEQALQALHAAEQELQRRTHQQLPVLTPGERDTILSLADDLEAVWSAPSTTDRDRKELLRAFLEEVMLTRDSARAPFDVTLARRIDQ